MSTLTANRTWPKSLWFQAWLLGINAKLPNVMFWCDDCTKKSKTMFLFMLSSERCSTSRHHNCHIKMFLIFPFFTYLNLSCTKLAAEIVTTVFHIFTNGSDKNNETKYSNWFANITASLCCCRCHICGDALLLKLCRVQSAKNRNMFGFFPVARVELSVSSVGFHPPSSSKHELSPTKPAHLQCNKTIDDNGWLL